MKKLFMVLTFIIALALVACDSDDSSGPAPAGGGGGGDTTDPVLTFTWNSAPFTDGTNVTGTIPIHIDADEELDPNKCQFHIERDFGGPNWQTEYLWDEGVESGGGVISWENGNKRVTVRVNTTWEIIGGALINYRISGYATDTSGNTTTISVINFVSDD